MTKTVRSLSGEVVAITGGARGIGAATAAALVSQGARVAIGDIDLALAERTADELGGGTLALALDVTDRASFEAFLNQVESRLGPIGVLINNAGIMPVGPFIEETDATAQRLIDINLTGVLLGSKLALERFIPRRRGHLVNIASTAGKPGSRRACTYCATKHAVVGLSEAIRQEVRGLGIGVSIVMPWSSEPSLALACRKHARSSTSRRPMSRMRSSKHSRPGGLTCSFLAASRR